MCALVTGVQPCALPISDREAERAAGGRDRPWFELGGGALGSADKFKRSAGPNDFGWRADVPPIRHPGLDPGSRCLGLGADSEDRKSVVEGKSVSVRVDLGGRRISKKKQITRVAE